ncbi:PorT family protein [Flavobacterium sp. MAH-1]|uniref:PorT family protein n=1 Tax=Flavobacterium agri TaxID=2743471 RepID=A0A7Y9C5L3_9FLAO|nr:porin family protein [Flavobacterium agri]NUY81392.1 PorT family protein [Flavobacterium agri]NYA71416.1 PorT family protein [Flavobacterium agri]
MINKIAAAAILIMAFANAYAQEKNVQKKKFPIGVRAGYNLSNVTQIRSESRSSYYVGVFVPYRFAKWYGLQPEIGYSRQGAVVNKENYHYPAEGAPTMTYKLDYIGVALNNKVFVYKGLHLMVAPYADLLVHHNKLYIERTYTVKQKEHHDIGVIFGTGWEFDSGFGVELRFKRGFTDIVYYPDYPYVINSSISTSVAQLGITYKF